MWRWVYCGARGVWWVDFGSVFRGGCLFDVFDLCSVLLVFWMLLFWCCSCGWDVLVGVRLCLGFLVVVCSLFWWGFSLGSLYVLAFF